MEAIKISVTGNHAAVTKLLPITAGTVGLTVEFSFDESWEGLEKVAVFRCGNEILDRLSLQTETTVPWELMKKTGCHLWVGVYGCSSDGNVQIPTIWVDLGVILPGADPTGERTIPSTIPLWKQIYDKADSIDATLAGQQEAIAQLQTDTQRNYNEFYEFRIAAMRDISNQGYNLNEVMQRVNNAGSIITDLETGFERLVEHTVYRNLYGTVGVTDEDIAAAGEEGITCLTIGSDEVDLNEYYDILIRIYVPANKSLNTSSGMLRVFCTANDAFAEQDNSKLVYTQSLGISNACEVSNSLNNLFAVRAMFAEDVFLYGQVMKNGYSNSLGYAGTLNAWTSSYITISKGHYFHICAAAGNTGFKFPAGSYVEVYGR